jgi:glycerate dehydrogenase
MPDLTAEEVSSHWAALRGIDGVSEVVIKRPEGYPATEELHELIGDADAVFGVWISDSCVNETFLSRHPNLKYIATLGHGWGKFDVDMTRAKGITITNTIYGSHTIAEYAWALLMEVTHRVSLHSDFIKRTDWTNVTREESFSKLFAPQVELYGLTAGVVGLGSIGYEFAKMARGFGMNVVSHSRHKKEGAEYDFIEQTTLDDLLARSDVISLHAPYSDSSSNLISREAIAKMKDGAILINTARGGLVDETALYDALASGKLFGAGLDVLREEPPKGDNPLFSLDNAVITGHIAWLTKASRLRACDLAVENFKAYLAGKPVCVIN